MTRLCAWVMSVLRAGSDERGMSHEQLMARWEGRPDMTRVSDDIQRRVDQGFAAAQTHAKRLADVYRITAPDPYLEALVAGAIAAYVNAYNAPLPPLTPSAATVSGQVVGGAQ